MTPTKEMTPAMRKALQAVADGKVFRRYDTFGNKFVFTPGIASKSFYRAEGEGWIAERRGVGMTPWRGDVQMTLTVKGAETLAQAKEQQ